MRAGPAARRRAGAGAALAAAALCAACSIEKNYELLSLFFDGVPRPGTAPSGAASERRPGDRASAAAVSAHSAYAERRCGECHGDQARFGLFGTGVSKLDASVCLNCHGQVLDEHPLLHGPVAARACLWCHQPHDSPQPFLLAAASPSLCLQCHRFQLQGAPPTPPHQDMQRDCLECHRGHGGAQRYFLREVEAARSINTSGEPIGAGAPQQ